MRDGRVVKGVRFRDHRDVGDPVEHALRYRDEGADELTFYDITASVEGRLLDLSWVEDIARVIDIPFTVAGGIRTRDQAAACLAAGADKISINSPALERPAVIDELARDFGSQCIVVGIDSLASGSGHQVMQYTGDPDRSRSADRGAIDWLREASARGAGEVVLNCMAKDGVRQGYDVPHSAEAVAAVTIPVIASGGAGALEHFRDIFLNAGVSGALAASVFHDRRVAIPLLKAYLGRCGIETRQ